ncbi:MAG: hypothetical protein HPY45_14840 [Anaerolineae bacterium]|nr:hypothetical protein [Anaerolineae bacterium]
MPLYFTGPLQFSALYKWVCHGENCPECASLEGEIHPLDYWEATTLPGFHPNCDCSLVAAALTENQTTRVFARVLNWMLDAGMFAKIITNAPYSSMYKIFSRILAAGQAKKHEDEDESSVRTHRPGKGSYHSGGTGTTTMGGTRRTFSRTTSGDFTSPSFTHPAPIVQAIDGIITPYNHLNPRPEIPRPASIYASNRT